ncbi:MAG: MerR family transcriptional regulator [Planctomycetota bacterium]
MPLSTPFHGRRVALVGRLASMTHREAADRLRAAGVVVVDTDDASVEYLVLGEGHSSGAAAALLDGIQTPLRRAVDEGRARVLREHEFWQQLEMVDQQPEVRRLYTPAMLADLLQVPLSHVRRWIRRRLIVPVCEVRRLAYFDFREVAVARRLAELRAVGVSPRSIEKQIAAIRRRLPAVARPLADLPIVIRGRQIFVREGEELVEPSGQRHFEFDCDAGDETVCMLPAAQKTEAATADEPDKDGPTAIVLPTTTEQMLRMAADLEEDNQLVAAAEMYRAALAAGGPKPEPCFQLAELLYRMGDLPAARERYFVAVELDEDYVEARANLGCVLGEMGQAELAVAAFEGALRFHPDYADVHYHLARTLDELGRCDHAEEHWRWFLGLAPDSPWADEAKRRLEEASARLF